MTLATPLPNLTVTSGRVVPLKFVKTALPAPLVVAVAAAAVSDVEATADMDPEGEDLGQEVDMVAVVVDLDAAALVVTVEDMAVAVEEEEAVEEVIPLLHPLKQPRPTHLPTLQRLVVKSQR